MSPLDANACPNFAYVGPSAPTARPSSSYRRLSSATSAIVDPNRTTSANRRATASAASPARALSLARVDVETVVASDVARAHRPDVARASSHRRLARANDADDVPRPCRAKVTARAGVARGDGAM